MSGKATNVFRVLDNKFKAGATKESATMIADMESFSVAFSNGVQTWTPMDQEGWQRGLMTAKAITITLMVSETSEIQVMISWLEKHLKMGTMQKGILSGRCLTAQV